MSTEQSGLLHAGVAGAVGVFTAQWGQGRCGGVIAEQGGVGCHTTNYRGEELQLEVVRLALRVDVEQEEGVEWGGMECCTL